MAFGAKRRPPPPPAITTRLPRIDPALLALARGDVANESEVEGPPDPFGGLIPVLDEDDEEAIVLDDADLVLDDDPYAEVEHVSHAVVDARQTRD